MRVETLLVLDRDDIQQIPYQLVCEVMGSPKFGTKRVQQRFLERFSEEEINKIVVFRRQAHKWHLVSGVPDELRITPKDLELWTKLAEFCASI